MKKDTAPNSLGEEGVENVDSEGNMTMIYFTFINCVTFLTSVYFIHIATYI